MSGALGVLGAIALLSTNPDLISQYVVFSSWSSLLSERVEQQGLTSCTPPEPTSAPAPTDAGEEPSA
jgi:hypothetical protein